MLAAAAVGNVAARRAGLRGPAAEAAVGLGSAAVAVEVFAWSERHADSAAHAPAAPARPRDPARRGHPRAHARSSSRWAAPRWRRSCASEAAASRGLPDAHGHRGALAPRLDPEVFRLPVERIRAGYYTDAYFNLTKELLEAEGRHPRVTMQVFQKRELGARRRGRGDRRAQAVRRQRTPEGWQLGWDELEVHALHEGDEIAPCETVMTIEGDYSLFAHLETVYLGCMARRSLVMRNVREVVEAANGKPILFFPARHDHWLVQTGDGWAAHVAGAIGVSTDAQASWWGGRGVGTVPHALIAAFGGDTVAAARAFAERYADEMNVTVLVDFENDSVRTSLEVADALGDRLWGVRLDTSERLVDRALWHEMGELQAHRRQPRAGASGCARRSTPAGHERVRIVVSGGFDAAKIRELRGARAPVDSYGVGSSLLRGQNDFTADVVRVEGRRPRQGGPALQAQPAPGARSCLRPHAGR